MSLEQNAIQLHREWTRRRLLEISDRLAANMPKDWANNPFWANEDSAEEDMEEYG